MSDRDIEFIVNREKRVVVCKIWGCEDIAVQRIKKYTNYKATRLFMPSKYQINEVYIGIARCAPEDGFDEETGKQLALLRAKAKRGRAINRAINRAIKDMRTDITKLEEYGKHSVPIVQ